MFIGCRIEGSPSLIDETMHLLNTLILATSNPGKVAELQAILSPIKCIAQSSLHIQSAEETGLSFIENAIIKARHASRMSQKPALADDSGLVVSALKGQPGIYSARFAGPNASDQENRDHLLKALLSIPTSQRQAYFYCAIALVMHADDPTPRIATGILHGSIAHAPQGQHGFGYDPIFLLPNSTKTLAEISPFEKNKISHRGQALKQLSQLCASSDALTHCS
jgi:XTP/dITP diphosphohydrolase